MSKSLIIAEKPSVAQDLSRALSRLPHIGKLENHKDFFESDTLVISSAIGHLVELCMPNQQTGAKLKWSFEHLPIIPDHFELQPIDKTKGRLSLLIKLMKRKDVTEIINACDAGREGELIFRYLIMAAGVNKPIKRMWMQSMTPDAITTAYQNMRSDADMRPLADAAMCRSESDWLVGINGTRALTAYNSKYGGFSKTPVGRVKTPTLAIMVERELQILSFQPRDYWEVHGDFQVQQGGYPGRWFDPKFKKSTDEHHKEERLWTREQAEAIKARCQGKPGLVQDEKKKETQNPPLLYDLTSLQREAGFTASGTLKIAQSLYEKHKAITYPRTDSRFLPEDYVSVAANTLRTLSSAGSRPTLPRGLDRHAATALNNGWVRPNRRIFDNAKVSDHFAIIPTGHIPPNLSDTEQRIYTMILQRFVGAFFPMAIFEVTTRITTIEEDKFKTQGRIVIQAGWKEVAGMSDNDKILVGVNPGERALAKEVRVEQKVTKAPPRYTEATILSAMEGAGKLVDDEELRAAMSERGLGTPATRAATIDGLIADGYIIRAEKELVPTQSARNLIEILKGIGVDILSSAEMTGQWEYKLKQMEHAHLDRDAFMQEIRNLTSGIVTRAKEAARQITEQEYDDLDVACPQCQARPLKQDEKSYRCRSCKFSIWKVVASRPMSDDEIRTLLTENFLPPMTGFRSRFGQEFEAALELGEDFKVKFVTEKSEERQREAHEALRDDNVVAKCPICGATVHETDSAYICRNNADGKCHARLPKEMCKHIITASEAKDFFEKGKSPLITNFISKKGRPFSAHLLLNNKGKKLVQWEFPPREKGADGDKPAAKKKFAAKKTAGKKDE